MAIENGLFPAQDILTSASEGKLDRNSKFDALF